MPIQIGELLRTKLQRPGVVRDLVPRPRLIERLNQAVSVPLTLVCAPAGFGKSTLVSSWIAGITAGTGAVTPLLPAAWLSLDASDSDLILFLRYFIAALRTIFPGACARSADLVEAPAPPPTDVLFTALSNEIALLPDHFVLVLDDYYTIQGEAVHELLNFLVRHLPQPLHLVLISRMNPPLPVARLRARGQLVEIRTHDLRFTRGETAEYLGRVLPAPPSAVTVALAERRTEGWIAGLHLAGLSLRTAEDPETQLASLSGAEIEIAGYLVDEVLSQQSAEIQKFLLRTSMLDRFCASLCEAIAGSGEAGCNAHACLDWVERANLFVIPLDDRAEWYRYHHLFQDLLQQRLLAETSADQVQALHAGAAAWFAGQGLVDEAVHHALAARDPDIAARLMEQGLREVLDREDRATLERWLRLLPEDFIRRRPWLLLVKAFAFQFSYQLSGVWKLLDQIEALLDEGGEAAPGSGAPHDLQVLRGLIALFRGQQAFTKGQAARAIAYCEEALALLPERWRYARGGAALYWGLSMRASGRGEAAQRTMIDEYESLLRKTDSYALRLLFAASFNYLETGHLEEARRIAQLMLEQAPPGRLPILRGFAHYFLGAIFYCWNDLDAARPHFEELVDKRYTAHAHAARNGMIGLARVHLARAEISEAWQVAELLGQFDLDRPGQEGDDARSLRAQLEVRLGEAERAFRWADAYAAPAPDRLLTWLQDPHLAKAQILLARGTDADVQSALDITAALNEIAQRTFSVRFQIEILALRALALDMQGKAADALIALRQAVELARPGGFIRVFVDLGPDMQTLLLRLAQQGALAGQGGAQTVRRILAAFPAPPGQTDHAGIAAGNAGVVGSRSRAANARLDEPLFEPLVEPLTARELDVLALLRERLSNKEIARKLYLSPMTVKRHLVNIYGKLGVNKRWDAVLKAEALGVLPPR